MTDVLVKRGNEDTHTHTHTQEELHVQGEAETWEVSTSQETSRT